MPAVSKKQQRFFGMVRAAQKGEMENPSKEVLDVADDISVKDAKKFAKTKHKGLPEKKMSEEIQTEAKVEAGRCVKEDVGYKAFIKQAQDARERVKKRAEENKKKDAQFVDTKKYGVKFYDKKGSGRIVKGKKIYN